MGSPGFKTTAGVLVFLLTMTTSVVADDILPPVEVSEYRGEKLDSIKDFRENSIKGPQQLSMDDYRLAVFGLVEKPASYSYDRVLEFETRQKVVTLHCVEGWSAKILWEGIMLNAIFEDVGVRPEATVVIFHAHDGYTTSLPLNYIRDRNILMAYRMNGLTLPPERGFPFQLVAEWKYGYKWIRWITKIELSDDENYRGFWESQGYSQSGDLRSPMFD
jgi:DMSO/TMAO reductase YedYZ molybdopterin-dependent catalytic subunit